MPRQIVGGVLSLAPVSRTENELIGLLKSHSFFYISESEARPVPYLEDKPRVGALSPVHESSFRLLRSPCAPCRTSWQLAPGQAERLRQSPVETSVERSAESLVTCPWAIGQIALHGLDGIMTAR